MINKEGGREVKRAHNEKGYTLFLVVLMIVVFSVISMSLITVTISGAKRSEVRENVTQAGELAEKGLKHLTQQINFELQQKLDEYKDVDGVTKDEFITMLGNIANGHKCVAELEPLNSTETGKYYACVKELLDQHEHVLPQRVKILTVGESEGKQKTLESIVEFNGNVFPDDMEYVSNTFITKECAENEANCVPGEGNMFIHGGVSLTGDINVERHLITSNRSHEKYIYHHWIHSYFPMAEKKENGETPKIIVGGQVYTLTWDSAKYKGTDIGKFDYNKHISLINDIPKTAPYKKMEEINQNVFAGAYVPEVSERTDHLGRNKLNITGEIEAKRETLKTIQLQPNKYGPDDKGVKKVETRLGKNGGVDRVVLGKQFPDDKVFLKWYSNYGGNFYIRKKSTFKQLATAGTLYLGGVRSNNDIEFIESAYVEKDLKIRNDTKVKGPIYVNRHLDINSNGLTVNSHLHVNGNGTIRGKNQTFNEPIYVNGDLTIDGRNQTFNAPIYVNGNLTIKSNNITIDTSSIFVNKNMKIDAQNVLINCPMYINGNFTVDGGLYKDNSITINSVITVNKNATIKHIEYDPTILDELRGDHILYANGKILIERINRFNNQAVKLNAYYYSNESIQIDGNESKIYIRGGISAPRIVLNAIRGRSSSWTRGEVSWEDHQITLGEIPLRYFEGTSAQKKRESRLQIVYDDRIFEQYSHLLIEDRITETLPPKLKEMTEQ